MDKLERIAVLYLTFLGHPGGLSFAKIREYLPEAYNTAPGEDPESVRRKFERDKEELRSLGMDLRHHAAGEALPDGTLAPQSIYVVADELQRLPAVDLSRAEVHTLAAILMAALADSPSGQSSGAERALLESAAYKLLYKHPALLQNRGETTRDRPTSFKESAPDVTEYLTLIHEGLARRRSLGIDYTNKTGHSERRRIDGRGLISHRGRWCLIAFCHRAQGIRMFYVDRITHAELTENEYPTDRNFDIQQYSLHPLALRIEAPVELRVIIESEREDSLLDFLNGLPASSQVRQSNLRGDQTEVRLETTNPTAFFSWMMRHPGSIRGLGPVAVHERFLKYLEALKQNYAGDSMLNKERESGTGGAP